MAVFMTLKMAVFITLKMKINKEKEKLSKERIKRKR